MSIDFEYIKYATNQILSYLPTTLFLTFITFIVSIILGTILAFGTLSKNKILNGFLQVWLSFFRGTPQLAQLYFFVFALFPILPVLKDTSSEIKVILCLSLGTSSYMCEIIRGAIESVDKGQLEGCLSIGMTRAQAMARVILPQAVQVAIPPLSNNFLDILKGTSLAGTVGVTEMLVKGKMITAVGFKFMDVYIVLLLIYWGLNIFFTQFQRAIERKIASNR